MNRSRTLVTAAVLGVASLVAAPVTATASPRDVPPPTQVLVGGVAGFSTDPQPAFPGDFDWATRARAYDAFAYDWTDRGSYTTIMQDTTANNMPAGSVTYKMPAYYGDTRVSSMGDDDGDGYQEAVAQMSSVIGATLVGIDKSDQACTMPGHSTCDYVDMLQTFFHPDLGVAKDTPLLGHEGDGKKIPGTADGWYAMIPNVLYYMLGEQYPDAQNMQQILRSIADKFYTMTNRLGGPHASFAMQDYDFADGEPVSGRDESADIASATAAVELWAYEHFGDAKYLRAARWAMDSLERQTTNTYYEVLPLLAPYVAARMNALYGTSYDVAKLFRWLMQGSATRGGWGTLGSSVPSGAEALAWGDHTVSGLSGSLTDKGFDGDDSTQGYGFAMNSFATTWLAATAKYDTRYANSVGRWLLDVNDASRFFFADQLPASQQQYGSDYTDGTSDGVAGSSTGWADDDRAGAIAYEALQPSTSTGIWATSDIPTRSGNWGVGPDARGLGLYGSGWMGFMSIVHPTNVPNVLRTDLDALDTFGENRFPTSLYYNPGDSPAAVTAVAGDAPTDLYDTVTGTYLARSVTHSATITVPAGSSAVVVELPAGTHLTTDGSTTEADGSPIAYDTNPQRDLAAGATASATAGDATAAALTDGSDATAWTSTSRHARSATIDLGTQHEIGTVDLSWGASHPSSYTIKTSADGSDWTTAQTVTDASGGDVSVTFPAVNARYVKIAVPTPSSGSTTTVLRTVSVYVGDLALGAPATVSDSANTLNVASALTDGSPATRWESATRDDVWAQVDLGSVRPLSSVTLVWETAASKEYVIQASDDAQTWSTVASVTDGTSGETRSIPLDAGTSARYVRVSTQVRATQWANSLFRLSVYGEPGVTHTAATPIPTTTVLAVAPASQRAGATGQDRATATVTVTSSTGEVPQGTVQLRDGATVLSSASLAAGGPSGAARATIQVPGTLGAGAHHLVAAFVPGAHSLWAASTSSSVAFTVTQVAAPVSLSVTRAGAAPRVGDRPKVRVHVSTSGTWTGGVVTLRQGGKHPVTVTVPSSGTATARLARKVTKAGHVTVTASYAGSAAFRPASDSVRLKVRKARTTTRVKARKKVHRGAKIRVKVRVRGAEGVSLKGKAKVTVRGIKAHHKKIVTTVHVNRKGKAHLKVRARRTGKVRITAVYGGNANQAKSSASTKVRVRR